MRLYKFTFYLLTLATVVAENGAIVAENGENLPETTATICRRIRRQVVASVDRP